jgi:hypothetical protein
LHLYLSPLNTVAGRGLSRGADIRPGTMRLITGQVLPTNSAPAARGPKPMLEERTISCRRSENVRSRFLPLLQSVLPNQSPPKFEPTKSLGSARFCVRGLGFPIRNDTRFSLRTAHSLRSLGVGRFSLQAFSPVFSMVFDLRVAEKLPFRALIQTALRPFASVASCGSASLLSTMGPDATSPPFIPYQVLYRATALEPARSSKIVAFSAANGRTAVAGCRL